MGAKMADKQTVDENLSKQNIQDEDEEIDYNCVKLKYLDRMNDEYAKNSSLEHLFSKDSLTKAIEELKCMKFSNSKWLNSEWATSYDVVNIVDPSSIRNPNGYYILTLLDDPFIEVLSYEDSFDVFYEVYMYRIPDRKKLTLKEMLPIIEENYCVSELSLQAFIKCLIGHNLVEEEFNLIGFNDRVELHILDIRNSPDNEFRFVLVYYDITTGFVLLRPLLEMNKQEIASELIQIFVDFGLPKFIMSSSGSFLNEVMTLLRNSPMNYDAQVTVVDNNSLNQVANRIAKEFEFWISIKNLNWAIGCHVLQHSINSYGIVNPYKKVFGMKAKIFNSIKTIDKASDLNTGKPVISLGIKKKEGDKSVQIAVCYHCNSAILFKTFKCHVCQNSFHLVCVNRLLMEEQDTLQSIIICNTCNMINVSVKKDLEEVK